MIRDEEGMYPDTGDATDPSDTTQSPLRAVYVPVTFITPVGRSTIVTALTKVSSRPQLKSEP